MQAPSGAGVLEQRPSTAASGEGLLVNSVILLSFFPFIRYIPIGESESQPVAAVVAAIALVLVGVSTARAARAIFGLITCIFGFALLAVVGMNAPTGEVIPQAVAYAAPLLILLFLWDRTHLISWPLVLGCAGAYFTVGVLQFTGLIPGAVEAILEALIPRYQPGLVGGGRGVVMLAPEPDYASRQILLFAALALNAAFAGHISRRKAWIAVAISGAVMIVLNRSITGIGLYAIFLSTLLLARMGWRGFIILLVAVSVATPLALNKFASADVSDITDESPRIVQLGAVVAQEAARGTFGFKEVVRFGSTRIVTNVAAIRTLSEISLFGVGIGQAEKAVISAIQNDSLFTGLEYAAGNMKPQSYLVSFVLETGMVGCALVLVALGTLAWGALRRAAPDHVGFALACIVLALTQLMLLGPHSLPEPWILFALAASWRGAPLSRAAER